MIREKRRAKLQLEKEQQFQEELAYAGFKMNLYAQLSLEIDKSLLTLASAAVGLLVTLTTKEHAPLEGRAVTVALLFFTSVIASTLSSLKMSKEFVVQEHKNSEKKETESEKDESCFPLKERIDIADFYSRWAFGAGVVSTFLATL